MEIATLVVSSLCLVLIAADLAVSARYMRPVNRRAMYLELARMAVAASEHRFRNKVNSNVDKARYAREYLVGQGLTPAQADVLVEMALSEVQKKNKPSPPLP